ncbi:MAG: hypothetical protein Q4E65_09890 [Clostridia bacterium]|nr:hypothetical protein [Clostridia bacterium]
MKRLLCTTLLLCMLVSLTGCQRGKPGPEFPLSEEALMQEVAAAGLSWVLSEEESQSYTEGHTSLVLRDPEAAYTEEYESMRLCASVSSAMVEGERLLFLIFDSYPVSTNGGKTPFPFAWEDWESQLLFAARLYGGFADEAALYQAFAAQSVPADTPYFAYEAWFPHAYCRISYQTRDTRVEHTFPEAVALEQSALLRVNLYPSEALYQKRQAEAEASMAEWERARTDAALRERLIEELEERRAVQEQRRAELFD